MAKNDVKTEPAAAQTDLVAAMKEALSTGLKEGIATGMAMQAKISADAASATKGSSDEAIATKIRARQQCAECLQPISACGGVRHRKVVVFPKDENYSKWFQGITINGIRYLSNGPGHLLTVPADAAIESMISIWESNERILEHGRQKQHNSGTFGPGQTNINPATAAWR